MTDANFNRTLMTQMFHSDFKQHLKAIDMLSKYIDADLEGLVANLDLILKWVMLSNILVIFILNRIIVFKCSIFFFYLKNTGDVAIFRDESLGFAQGFGIFEHCIHISG